MCTETEKKVRPDQTRSFANLPHEILSRIADGLPIIELLSFCGTCKDFRSASSTASAKIESLRTPWILLHKNDSSECVIYNEKESKTYNREIPDLKGAICLASNDGWLLLFKDESMFFFCPFSQAKIVLPEFPHKQISGHVAAFSDVPTSRDCIVGVINRTDERFVEINVIFKGQSAWTPHIYQTSTSLSSCITAGTFDHKSQIFCFMDDGKTLLEFSAKDNKWTPYVIVKGGHDSKGTEDLSYGYKQNLFRNTIGDKRGLFKLEDDEYVTVCGLSFGRAHGNRQVYLNEVVNDSATKTRERRAVWVQPRFFEVDSKKLCWTD